MNPKKDTKKIPSETLSEVELKVQLESAELKKDQEYVERFNAFMAELQANNRELIASATIFSKGTPQWRFGIVRTKQ